MGDWLGTGTIQTQKRKYLPYQEAREYISSLKLTNEGNWRKFRKSGKLPSNILKGILLTSSMNALNSFHYFLHT